MADGNSEDSFVMEDIACEDNDFEEDVQTALVHTDKVSHDRVPSARSSARSMHDSFTVESPIPGERQVFSRPADLEAPNSFMQTSYCGGGLPPLPDFPAYSAGSAVQAGMSNPLFGEEESSPDVADESEQDRRLSSQTADFSRSLSQPYAAQPQAAYYADSSNAEAAAAEEGQEGELIRTVQDSGANDYSQEYDSSAAVSSIAAEPVHRHAAADISALPCHSSDTAPYMSTASGQSADAAAAPNSLRQASSFNLHSQQGPAMDHHRAPSRSARSISETLSTSPTTPAVVDDAHSVFQMPGSQDFTPAHLPARRLSSQTSAVSQRSTPQPSSSAQPVFQQNAPYSSSDMQYMQPAPVYGGYQDDAEEQQSYASSREVHDQGEGDYREQYAAVSRPASAQRRQAPERGHPPRPYSPMPDEYYDEDLAGSSIPAYHPPEPPQQHSPRTRPGSAMASRARLAAAVQQSMQHSVHHWAVAQVCDWADYIGLGQYRKKFVHHCIDGRLLLSLTHKDLKEEMGIAPLGHRQGLLMAIADLAAFNSQTHGNSSPQHSGLTVARAGGRPQTAPSARGISPGRPRSAGSVSPDRGLKELQALKALELREHLLHEMQKAQARAAHREARAGQAVHHAQIAELETKKLKGQIFDLERKAGLKPLIRPSSGVAPRMGDSLDVLGHIPWHPAGKGRSTTPLCKAGPELNNDANFHPHINQHSQEIMQERRGSNGSASFLNRLEADTHGRKMRLQNKAEQLHSAVFGGDPRKVQRDQERDAHQLRHFVQSKTNQDLPKENMESALEELVATYKTELGLTDKEADQLEHLQGHAKAQRLVAILKGHQFMERYQAEINARDERIKESKKLGREVPKKTRTTVPEVKVNTDEVDVKKCADHFESCGWDALEFDSSSGGPDKKFDALMKRVRAQQEAQDKANAATQASKAATVSMLIPNARVDWTKFRSDGLEPLQESQVKKQEAASAKAGSKEAEGKQPRHNLNWTVHLLAACRQDELDKLEKLQGVPRCVAIYRAINSQRFLEFTKEDLRKREEKHERAIKALQPQRKHLKKEDADKFFDRLMDDTEKRNKNRAEMIRKAREAEDKKIADFQASLHASQKHRQPRRAH